MSTLSVNDVIGKSGQPVNFPTGITVGGGGLFGNVNYIGLAGSQGFGVGICPSLPAGFAKMAGSEDTASDNYGNYQYSDGSVMCWIPAFYYKIGSGSNGLAVNVIGVKGINDYIDLAAANAGGYALHRAFYNANAIQPGVFVDKYQCSNNNGIASSLKNGNPLSSALAHNPFSGLTGAPANNCASALLAAKTRGSKFFCNSRFIFSALAMLSMAHGQAATSATSCAWYDAAGIKNFPKGNNNNALGDINDTSLAFVSDGYVSGNSSKTGSANFIAKTAHNGMNCGVVDLNGNMWEINPGITSSGTGFYLLKTSADIAALTGGAALSTDLWGASGIAANYDLLGATYESLTASSTLKYFNSTAQVFSESVSGNHWAITGAGIPLATGVSTGGTNAMGNDGLWDYSPDQLCPLAGSAWSDGASAGVWALYLYYSRVSSAYHFGFRSALYL